MIPSDEQAIELYKILSDNLDEFSEQDVKETVDEIRRVVAAETPELAADEIEWWGCWGSDPDGAYKDVCLIRDAWRKMCGLEPEVKLCTKCGRPSIGR